MAVFTVEMSWAVTFDATDLINTNSAVLAFVVVNVFTFVNFFFALDAGKSSFAFTFIAGEFRQTISSVTTRKRVTIIHHLITIDPGKVFGTRAAPKRIVRNDRASGIVFAREVKSAVVDRFVTVFTS